MFLELVLATALVTLTVAIHAVGLYILPRLLRLEERDKADEQVHPLSPRGIGRRSSSSLVDLHCMAWKVPTVVLHPG